MSTAIASERMERVRMLRRNRSRSWYLRISGIVVFGMVFWAWVSSQPLLGRLSASRRWENLKGFAGDLIPRPVQKSGDWFDAGPWAWGLLTDEGFVALLTTFGIATAAILLAGALVFPFLILASRQLARTNPFGIWGGNKTRLNSVVWKVVGPAIRFVFVIARAVPEYLIAFLLLSLLGLQVWPLVLALAIHNFGILGRLWGEVVENADTTSAEQAVVAGQSRSSAFLSRIVPASFNRFLIYLFYRWETCVKDATVLGMLGLLTLGKLIALAKGFFWDQMFFYILLGASVILLGDLLSTYVRRKLR